MKIQFSRQIFEKYSNVKYHVNFVQWEPSCFVRAEGWTDRHDEANRLLRNFAIAPNNHSYCRKRPRLVATKSVFYHMLCSAGIVTIGTTCFGVIVSSRSSSSQSTHCIIFSGSAGGGYTSSFTSCLLQLQYAVDTWTRAWK